MKYLPLIRLLVNRELTLRYKRSLESGHVKLIGKASDVVDAYEAN